MKRILHISKYYYPFVGGVEQMARNCVNVLKDRYEQKVICFNHEKGNIKNKVDGIDIIRCGCQMKISSQPISFSIGFELKKLIKEFKPDYIIFHYPNPYVSYFLLKYINPDSKLILYWQLDIIKQKLLGKLFHNQNLKLTKRANKIIATSLNYINGSKYLIQAKEKCIVVPGCINEERLQLNNKIIEDANYIRSENDSKIICLSVGRHVSYKGFEYLIDCSKLLDDRFVFYITGQGILTEQLKKRARDDKKINFLGLIDAEKLKAYLLASDIFCFPSITKNEAFGIALAEAMYFGKPAVTFNIPGSGVNYVNLSNITGIEVPNRSVEKYAEALITLADNPGLRAEYGNEGRKRVMSNFLFKQFNDNIRKIFID